MSSMPDERTGCPEDREEVLSRLLEDDLTERERLQVERHLSECGECRRSLQDMERLVSGMEELRDISPPPELFDRVSAAVEGNRRRLRWARLCLAAGLGALVVLGAVLAAHLAREPVAPRVVAPLTVREGAVRELLMAEIHYRKAIAMLRELVAQEKEQWDIQRRSAYEQDVALLEQGIRESRRLARRAPTDPGLQRLLFSSYRAQIDYLQEILNGREDETI